MANNSYSPAEKITQYLLKETTTGRELSGIGLNESLVASGLIDSIGVLGLVGFLEEEFNIELEADDVTLDNFDTIAAMCKLLGNNHGL